mgnify:FL=1
MLFASIDIGSNAVRLFFFYVFETDGVPRIEKASLIRIPIRLGDDVFKTGTISENRIENLLKTLKAFNMLIDVYKPVDYIACATSAMREAENNIHVLERIKKETGILVKVIDGMEEAIMVCSIDNLVIQDKYSFSVYIDVGGGSTEISVLKNHVLINSESFQIGTIRMLNNKVQAEEWQRMITWLNLFKNDFGKLYLVGSGGNINKLSKLYSTQADYSLSLKDLKKGLKKLNSLTVEQRVDKMGLRPDRADVIVPAAEIFLAIMNTTQSEYVNVPRIGLSDGLIYSLYKKYKEKNI